MKLDKWQKQGIVTAIMDDVPRKADAQIKEEIQAAMVKAMSAPIRRIYKTHPKALAKTWARGLLAESRGFDVIHGDANAAEVFKPFEAEIEARNNAKRNLTVIVEGCGTLKQLQAALPEFVKYMPTEAQPTKNLPMLANVVADLTKMGWPKGKKVAA